MTFDGRSGVKSVDIKKILNWDGKMFLVVLGFLIIVIGLYIIFALLKLETQILAASITFALLLCTYIYATNTSQMIRELKIDRELKNIKEKLSGLYSPLKFHPTILQITPEELYRFKERSYLASESMQKILYEYFKAMDEFGDYVDTKSGKKLSLEHNDPRFVDLKKRFDEQVDANYESLLGEMEKTIGEKD